MNAGNSLWSNSQNTVLMEYELSDLMLRTEQKWKQTDIIGVKLVFGLTLITLCMSKGLQHTSSDSAPFSSARFFRKTNSTFWAERFPGQVCLFQTPTWDTHIALDGISSGFHSPLSILSWNQNNFRGSFRPRLYWVNLSKVSQNWVDWITLCCGFWVIRGRLLCWYGSISETSQRPRINHLTDVWLLRWCVWFAFTDQDCVFQRCSFFNLFFKISLACFAK